MQLDFDTINPYRCDFCAGDALAGSGYDNDVAVVVDLDVCNGNVIVLKYLLVEISVLPPRIVAARKKQRPL